MQRFFITVANCVLLVVALLGMPDVAELRFWRWQISSIATAQALMLWGLAIAVAGNAVTALFLLKGRKERKLCWLWASIFGVLLGVEFAFVRGWFNFQWLKEALLWLQNHL